MDDTRFNGATALMRWKLCRLIADRLILPEMLQWSHRVDAVEALDPMFWKNRGLMLQWSHRVDAVEAEDIANFRVVDIEASMEPPR